ncbi:glycerophosphodiester phosphodiesterase family protein [Sphingomonas sp. ZT3P38]|uniref:glycerophosphodiester phosphodiesterase n=1 Tax=Parasphingomonas zepuensis TaxID=3096161 RepID=UPI002FC956F4
MTNTQNTHRARHRNWVAGGMAAAIMLLSAPAHTQDKKPVAAAPHIAVIAHRGGAMSRPENTMPAFRHAAALGAEIIEFDMEMTADDRIVVYHDADINPAFCFPPKGSKIVPGPVRGLSFADSQTFDCGSGVRPAYSVKGHVAVPGARIPALDEVLSAFQGGDAILFAETKIPKPAPGLADIDPVKFATMLDTAVRKYGLEDRLILQSFDFRTIDALHDINPRVRTCLLGAPKLTSDYPALLRQHHASCIVLGSAQVDRDGVARLREAGVLVFSDVVDTPADWEKVSALGMDAIFTNDPAGLIGFLKQAGLRP